MNLATRILNIDRRVIYLLVFISAIVPFMFKTTLEIKVTPEVASIYDFIESLEPGTPILLAADYDP